MPACAPHPRPRLINYLCLSCPHTALLRRRRPRRRAPSARSASPRRARLHYSRPILTRSQSHHSKKKAEKMGKHAKDLETKKARSAHHVGA